MSINKKSVKYIVNPTCFISTLGFLFCMFTFQYCIAIEPHKKKGIENTMTVTAIRTPNNNETFGRVTFVESQRFYKLPNDANPLYLVLLKESKKNHTPVIITRAKEESVVILKVRKP